MSGPITTGYLYVPSPSMADALLEHLTPAVYGAAAVVAALAALREARISYDQYQQVLAQAQRDAQAEAQREAQARASRIVRCQQWLARHEQLSCQSQRLRRLLASLDVQAHADLLAQEPPTQPPGEDETQWAQHLSRFTAFHDRLQAALAQARLPAGAAPALPDSASPGPQLPDLLHSYAMEQALRARLSEPLQQHYRAEVLRVLARAQPPSAAPASLPAELEALGARVLLAPDTERAEALLSDLRLAVQRAQEIQAQRAQDGTCALRWLAQLGADAPPALVATLEAVAAGRHPLDDALRHHVETLLAQLQADHRHLQDQAAAVVLEQSLRDLGYDVSEVSDTLFTEGGLLHFQRQGWEGYFVRLRVNPEEHSLNFNVVRARRDEDSQTLRQQDTLAEDRWCREFPQLQATLAARGLQLNVTRQLGAGELPVQAVAPASLPAVHARARQRTAPPRQKTLNGDC